MGVTQPPPSVAEPASLSAPLRQLLGWLADRPRTYAATMAAWRSSCPRLTVWEDALDAGLVSIRRDGATDMASARVDLTPLGRASLEAG